MDATTEALAEAIGGRVRQLRLARGWTLDQLADAAGVSRRMVVNVEQAAVNPSVGTLLRLAGALGVGLPTLVEPPSGLGMRVTRAGEAATLWTGSSGGHGDLVAATAAPDVVELWDWTLGPDDDRSSESHTPGTRELLHVREGSVVVTAAGESVTLGVGDAVVLPGDVAHSYANAGATTARFTLTVFEPGATRDARPGTAPERAPGDARAADPRNEARR